MSEVYPLRGRIFRPWKNGGGETAEILVSPPGAGFDDFDWRISTAIVAGDGPFSAFPGIDRVLTVIEGGTMHLSLPDQVHQLNAISPPLAFAGDLPCQATITGGPILDFNVMVRRPLRAEVTRGPLPHLPPDKPLAYLALLFAGLRRSVPARSGRYGRRRGGSAPTALQCGGNHSDYTSRLDLNQPDRAGRIARSTDDGRPDRSG